VKIWAKKKQSDLDWKESVFWGENERKLEGNGRNLWIGKER